MNAVTGMPDEAEGEGQWLETDGVSPLVLGAQPAILVERKQRVHIDRRFDDPDLPMLTVQFCGEVALNHGVSSSRRRRCQEWTH
ncbi:hypothetical protein D3C81_2077140 [compost metagenome]